MRFLVVCCKAGGERTNINRTSGIGNRLGATHYLILQPLKVFLDDSAGLFMQRQRHLTDCQRTLLQQHWEQHCRTNGNGKPHGYVLYSAPRCCTLRLREPIANGTLNWQQAAGAAGTGPAANHYLKPTSNVCEYDYGLCFPIQLFSYR